MNTTKSPTTSVKSGSRRANVLPSGYMLDEYRIDAILGVGGFGVTYKALDTHLESWVAIKEYFPMEWSFRDDDGVTVHANTQGHGHQNGDQISDYLWGLERFLDEARVLARIQHPNVVRVKRYFRAHGTAYIVMDYEEGIPLSTLLRDGETLSEEEIRRLLEDVLPALQAIHGQGYLHRDIKPANLYLRASDQRAILIDFGAARAAVGRQSKSVTSLVTPGYSPPEQYTTRNERYGTWTDIYALAAVLYRCITGRIPVEAAGRLLDDCLEPASVVGVGRYSSNLLRVIDQSLMVRPEQRLRTVADMQAALTGMSDANGDETVILPPVRFDKAEPAPSVEDLSISPPEGPPSHENGLETLAKPVTVDSQPSVALKSGSVNSTVPDILHWQSLGVQIGGSLAVAMAAALAVTVAVWLWPSVSVTPAPEEPSSPPRYSLDQSGRAVMTAPAEVVSSPDAPIPNEAATAGPTSAIVAPVADSSPSEAASNPSESLAAGTEASVESPPVATGVGAAPPPRENPAVAVEPRRSDGATKPAPQSETTSIAPASSSTSARRGESSSRGTSSVAQPTPKPRRTERPSRSRTTRREASQKREALKPIVITPASTRSRPTRAPVTRNPWEAPASMGFNQK